MALFKTTQEIQQYIPVDVNMNFKRIKPSIEQAESEFIVSLLGKEQYEALLTAYTSATPESPLAGELAALLPYVQRSLAYYAGFLSVEELGVSVGDAGIQQQSSVNSQPAPAWKVKDLKLKYITTADKCADLLLEFLESSAVIPDGQNEEDRVYKEWYYSEANTSLSGCIVYKTSIANKYIDINNSRRLFLRLKKRIKEIESSYVRGIVCGDQYAQILSYLKGEELTNEEKTANKNLIELLEPIISKRALYATLPMLPVIITADGLFLQTSNDSVIQKLQAGTTEVAKVMQQLKDDEYTGYVADEARLQQFIINNINDYPLIKDSPCYTGSVVSAEDRWKIDNHPSNKHFST